MHPLVRANQFKSSRLSAVAPPYCEGALISCVATMGRLLQEDSLILRLQSSSVFVDRDAHPVVSARSSMVGDYRFHPVDLVEFLEDIAGR